MCTSMCFTRPDANAERMESRSTCLQKHHATHYLIECYIKYTDHGGFLKY